MRRAVLQNILPTPLVVIETPIQVLTNYLIRLAVEGRGDDYHSFPQRNLFDKLGIRSALIETDTYGNFLGQGLLLCPLGTGRVWVICI